MPRDIQVLIEPEDKSAEALAAHIRASGHAFSMFDAARLVLAEGDRFQARFQCATERATGLFVTPADGGIFLSREEAVNYVLRGPALETYYRAEETEMEEPKGDFKSIGVCGMSGELVGPPSHHSFQTTVIRLHRERFSHMPLEEYKRRVRVETNPELVAQWKEKQRKGMRWVYVKDVAEGAEPQVFNSRAEVEAHFRRMHGDDAVREVREVVIHGNLDKAKMTHVLFLLLRNAVENARKHLFEMSQKLGGGFERRGLKLFKRRAGKLFVSRVKPRAVDPGVVFSMRVMRIVEALKGKAGVMLHDLVESICPSPAPAPPAADGKNPKAQPTDEQIAVIKDIRWLANEGYVIEYSDGMVFLGVQGEIASTPKTAAAAPEKSPVPTEVKVAPAEDEVAPAEDEVAPVEAEVEPAEAAVEPAETAVEPAEAEVEPAEAEVEPVETEVEPAEAVVEPVEAEVEPAETEVEPAETAVEPVETEVEPDETAVEPVEDEVALAEDEVTPGEEIAGGVEEAANETDVEDVPVGAETVPAAKS